MKKENPKISAALRTVTGRKVKNLRLAGLTPATIYGHKFEPISIELSTPELNKIFDQAGESLLVEIVIGENNYPIIFKNPQFHPVSSDLIHIDCYKVNLKEKISTMVPIELIGEAPAVKNGNTLMFIQNEIEVEALPSDLPEKIEVDVSLLAEVDNKITVAELNVDRNIIEIKTDPEQVVVIIEAQRVEEEPVVVEEEISPEDVPATAQKTEEEKAAKEAAEGEEEKTDK
ncbi:MAG: 50S ribosomal protein L25 [Candidatus Shapirobacteria bacterium GW2011_GWE1_38_10]|uniref:Large ribosomal subunit protein bL25 n=1 Tax=Candidatus Shapirobacteria bacterium GW2011_GWE1_38_10 TaxID=1618488 RepID=A0A0G0KL54_9BACT|nr:MAG: 50S ribosomal protein L25 [Candidatus Shapirobacteria bacterium GW2011_GWF2_37_20]KKQ49914.1 MAG: 50S ribosomal protein L25 [Candidatus Shapirobacteria bacterium GW2011_GWE1_38_10]KKQ62419.1 MAG: 50S ribosomal protein L25 [Candidatus Shapirobacteria bacterium GW2011_GWF1_38_23]HBP51542.1 50S ribosomal protein L25 [Candidatus Shapirobacteria bacterium]